MAAVDEHAVDPDAEAPGHALADDVGVRVRDADLTPRRATEQRISGVSAAARPEVRGAGRYLARTARVRLEVYTIAPQLALNMQVWLCVRMDPRRRLIAPDIVGGQVAW